jgi:predicted RNase H-like HicB family nuclease
VVDYVAVVHKDADSDFGVSFPDFPGCITAGQTLEEAKQMAVEALTGHIDAMLDTGEAVPDASTLDEVMRDPDFSDGVAFLVSIRQPEKQSA